MKEICDRCGNIPVAKYKLVNVTGALDCTILDELWLCDVCLPQAVRTDSK